LNNSLANASFPTYLGALTQLGFIVSDLQASLEYWTETLKVGPFVVIENPVGMATFTHRGKLSGVQMSIAFSYVGDTMIELVKQHNDAPSPYVEFLSSGREGLHHIAFWPADFEGTYPKLLQSGFSEVAVMHSDDGVQGLGYLDSPARIGIMVEIVRMTKLREVYYAGIRRLATNWDGKRPIRRFRTYADYIASDDCKQ
jgi:hypothetical protein